jgi:hypothetical protein
MLLSITQSLETTSVLAQNVGKCGYFDFPGKTLLNALANPPGY